MREINLGTSGTVRLIEGVCLIRCPLNTGFTVSVCLRVMSVLQRDNSKERGCAGPTLGVQRRVHLIEVSFKRELTIKEF